MNMKNKVILVDGSSVGYRAFFAAMFQYKSSWESAKETSEEVFKDIQDIVVKETMMIFGGYINTIYKRERLTGKDSDTKMFIAWDFQSGSKTFRGELYPPYKGNRKKRDIPVNLFPSLRNVGDEVADDSWNIEGYEADDIIGSAVEKYKSKDTTILIVSSDKDFFQLVDDENNVRVQSPIKGASVYKTYKEADVFKEFGVSPEKIVDYKALVGDSSDNFPGVRLIGPKIATELLNTYNSIDEVYSNLNNIKPGLVKKLEAGKSDAYLFQKIAQIVKDVQL